MRRKKGLEYENMYTVLYFLFLIFQLLQLNNKRDKGVFHLETPLILCQYCNIRQRVKLGKQIKESGNE